MISVIMLLASALAGCGRAAHITKSALFFDTVVSVELYGDDESALSAIADECMKMCGHYQELFDRHTAGSDIARINENSGQAVKVDPDTAELISKALEYSLLSNGEYDITIAPVSDLWDFHEGGNTIPDKDRLEKACRLVDHNNVSVDTSASTVTLLTEGSAIDVGGAAKGFVADRIASYLRGRSITGAIINMGGDMYLLGHKSDNKPFNIGINDPFNEGQCVMSVSVSDMAVATSGTYERMFIKDGVRYHHILDPATGMSADTDIESVTVITKNALDSDCLCTVCLLLGSDEALKLIGSIPDTEVIMILTDSSIVMSEGASDYITH